MGAQEKNMEVIESKIFPIRSESDESLGNSPKIIELCSASLQDWEDVFIGNAISFWLSQLSVATSQTYATCMRKLIEMGFIPTRSEAGYPYTIGEFNCERPHETVIDCIKKLDKLSESSKQKYCCAYISFTIFLERQTRGWFKRALPSRTGSNRTFFSVRDKAKTKALNIDERYRFLEAVEEINERDAIVAKCLLQGAKRISEVLEVTIENIDWEKRQIRFRQHKTKGTIKEIPITFPGHFMAELKGYIEKTKEERGDCELVFITRNGKAVCRSRLNQVFARASARANLKLKVTPHVLRTTAITTAKQQGISDSDIMTVSGHSSPKMVYYYDKTPVEENYTKKLTLI